MLADQVTQPVMWSKPVVGVTGGNETTFNDIDSQVGPVLARRTYNTTLPATFAASTAYSDPSATPERKTYWSWKPTASTFPTDTAAKNAFSAFVDSIPSGHPTVIAAWHEPEDQIRDGVFTLAQWGALQNSFADIVKSKGRSELQTAFCLMGPWTFDTASAFYTYDWASVVDMGLIDIVGIDPYRWGSGSSMSLETMLTVNNSGGGDGGSAPSTMQVLSSWGKPVSLMEWGVANSTEASAATYITGAYDWMKAWNQTHMNGAYFESAIYFNYTDGSHPDQYLTGVEIDAYAAAVADSKIPPA